jgi:hypothetical protein
VTGRGDVVGSRIGTIVIEHAWRCWTVAVNVPGGAIRTRDSTRCIGVVVVAVLRVT